MIGYSIDGRNVWAPQSIFDQMPCFIGFRPSQSCVDYLSPLRASNHRILTNMGWPVRPLVEPDKLHVTVLWFKRLPQDERLELWDRVETLVKRGVWDNLDFTWQGLEAWHDPKQPTLIALAAKQIHAVRAWGLETWLVDPICRKGVLKYLKAYRPHITMTRFDEARMRQPGHRNWVKEWEQIRSQLRPIDPARIELDRISLHLSDFSQWPHRYVYERTASIGRRVPQRGQLRFDFEG